MFFMDSACFLLVDVINFVFKDFFIASTCSQIHQLESLVGLRLIFVLRALRIFILSSNHLYSFTQLQLIFGNLLFTKEQKTGSFDI